MDNRTLGLDQHLPQKRPHLQGERDCFHDCKATHACNTAASHCLYEHLFRWNTTRPMSFLSPPSGSSLFISPLVSHGLPTCAMCASHEAHPQSFAWLSLLSCSSSRVLTDGASHAWDPWVCCSLSETTTTMFVPRLLIHVNWCVSISCSSLCARSAQHPLL